MDMTINNFHVNVTKEAIDAFMEHCTNSIDDTEIKLDKIIELLIEVAKQQTQPCDMRDEDGNDH